MKRIALMVLLMVGCDDFGKTDPPKSSQCTEFDHATVRDGKPMRCRMVWCSVSTFSTSGNFSQTGGVATLWCDEFASGAAAKP